MEIINLGKNIPVSYLELFTDFIIKILIVLLFILFIYYLIHIGNRFISERKKLKFGKQQGLIFLSGVVLFLFIIFIINYSEILWKIMMPVIWGGIFAYLFNPIVHYIHDKGIKRVWIVIGLYGVIAGIVIFFSMTISPKITREAEYLISVLPDYSKEINAYINKIYSNINDLNELPIDFMGIDEVINENLARIQNYILQMIKSITNGFFNLLSQIVGLILIPIYSFYFLKDAEYFKNKIVFVIPKSCKEVILAICRDINVVLSKFIRGQLIVALCVGLLSTFALWLLKVDLAFLLGVVAGISDIIPYFGPIIGAVPAVLIALLDEPEKAIWVIIAFTIIQQIESAILSPKIVGDSIGMHPVYVIISLLIGNELFGIAGLLFAVPIAASLKIIGKHIYEFVVNYK
ncbi:MAG: AI-2E family transporter [Bacillota bacterium]